MTIMNIEEQIFDGYLIHSENFGWQVKHYFGDAQSKNFPIHSDSLKKEDAFIEGEEVKFVIRGKKAPRTLNGVVSSALLTEYF